VVSSRRKFLLHIKTIKTKGEKQCKNTKRVINLERIFFTTAISNKSKTLIKTKNPHQMNDEDS